MKIVFASFILVVLALAFAGCGRIETLTNMSQQKIEAEKDDDGQPDEPPILEIVQDAQGMWNVTGKTLFLNLYENGVVEFEYEDDQKKSAALANKAANKAKESNILKAEEINVLKRAKISREELQKFADLLKSEAFQKTENDYQRKCCCTDASLDYQINFTAGNKLKNINLKGFCGLGELTNPPASKMPDFPKVLSDLLILAENARAKYNSEKPSNQPE